MLGFDTIEEVQIELYDKVTQTHGFFNWEEFLDFFLMHSSSKEEKNNPWWKKLMSDDQEKKAIAVVDRTEEFKKSAFERSTKNEKGEDLFQLSKEQSTNFQILSNSRVQKVSHEVEKDFKEHEDKYLKQSPSKRT